MELHIPGQLSTETSGAEPGTLAAAGEDAPVTQEPEAGRRRRRPVRTTLIVTIAILVAAAAGVAATGALGGDSTDTTNTAPSGPSATAKVERTTLSSTETVNGNLGYGDESTVRAPASSGGSGQSAQNGQSAQSGAAADSGGSGTVTWLPDEGVTIKRGGTVYKADQEKVPLLYGSTPLYRTLKEGSEGSDVKLLEQNLSALGYTGFTVDDEYTSGTADAVEKWQDDLGREETGTVEAADAVVATGARRVAKMTLSLGDSLSGDVLTWTGTERLITVDLDVEYEDSVKKGTKATITLPDDTEAEAVVTDVGTPTGGDSQDSSSGNSKEAEKVTLPVELEVKDQKKLGRYQAASVDVELKDNTRENVLAVPVNALLAERDGGYVLEVVTSKGSEYRPVELGMFADGRVEVSGDGITEGLVVGVPK